MGAHGRVEDLALQKIVEAKTLLTKIDEMEKNHVNGASKLRKRIQAEMRILNKGLKKGSEMKVDHVLCSNLGQLGALSEVAIAVPNVMGILQPFTISGYEKIIVDVVGESGKQWIKVIMRNPKALHLLFISGGRNGTKPLDEVADDFLICAEQHPVLYSAPKVVFWFCSGVSEGLARTLEDRGVQVRGQRIPDHMLGLPELPMDDSDSEDWDSSDDEGDEDGNEEDCGDKSEEKYREDRLELQLHTIPSASPISEEGSEGTSRYHSSEVPQCQEPVFSSFSPHHEKCTSQTHNGSEKSGSKEEAVTKLNLDITAMIAYVSATANGGANFVFKDKLLSEQAEWERKNPVKETLDGYFKGCELMACQEAVDHFMSIVKTIGGAGEQARARELVARLTVVPSSNFLKEKVRQGGKVSDRAKLVFGTGHVHRALTITSNGTFVRSVTHQGVNLAVLFHQARALTEAKECTAVPL